MRILHSRPSRRTSAQRLEARARTITKRTEAGQWDRTIASGLGREVALAIDQIDGVKRLHRKLERDLIRVECYIGTEILQREPPIPVYEDPRLPERDMLRARLLKIGQERRRLDLAEEEKLRSLHDRLLTLLNREGAIRER